MVGDMTLTEKSTLRRFAGYSRLALVLLLSVAIVSWSVVSSVSHTTFVVSDLEHHHHDEDVSGHGHSNSEAEDLWWALHGHSDDKADHDHSTFYIHNAAKAEARAAEKCQLVQKQQSAVLVLDAGTAITYTAANESGHFVGGAILPGCVLRLF